MVLQGDNYISWRKSMETALNAKNKLGFVDGSISPPRDDADPQTLAIWELTNGIVTSWIVNAVSEDLVGSIIFSGSAAAIWKDLEHQFQEDNASPRVNQLKKDLLNLSQELHRYEGGLLEGENRDTASIVEPDTEQGGVPSEIHADNVVAAVTPVAQSDVYHIGVMPSQRASIVIQRSGQRCHQKWKGPDKISRIYGDWIDDME